MLFGIGLLWWNRDLMQAVVWVQCLTFFLPLSSFSCYFGILKGGVLFLFFLFKHLHLCIDVFQLVVHGLDPWDPLCPAVFPLRQNGADTEAAFPTCADFCMWAAVVAQVTCMLAYNSKVKLNLLVVHLALLFLLQGCTSLTRERSILCLNHCLESSLREKRVLKYCLDTS